MSHNQPGNGTHNPGNQDRGALTRFAWLSIGAAVATISLKTGAYYLTGSVGLLSDAVESVVNLIGAGMALWMLSIAARPPDESHMHGHSKAEYFSSGLEGLLILIAAVSIGFTAVERLIHPKELEQLGIGLVVSIAASIINLVVAQVLLKAGKKHNSITLEADGQHLMTDVWTSTGVLGGIGLVVLTGWNILDPLVALAVAANIVWTAFQLLKRSTAGLMDASLSSQELGKIEKVLAAYREKGIEFHALRSRQAAARRFVSVHVLVPGHWTVHYAHYVAEDIEADIRQELGDTVVFTHLEPVEDEISLHDIPLDRD
ncbi:MAG: cation transporter [Anaerolineales bacterium]|nr:cation transporter [Anaerolineales bacterium]